MKLTGPQRILRAKQRRRQALALRICGMSYSEIAREIGVSPCMTAKLISRGMEDLRPDVRARVQEAMWLAMQSEYRSPATRKGPKG
jgi:transposase